MRITQIVRGAFSATISLSNERPLSLLTWTFSISFSVASKPDELVVLRYIRYFCVVFGISALIKNKLIKFSLKVSSTFTLFSMPVETLGEGFSVKKVTCGPFVFYRFYYNVNTPPSLGFYLLPYRSR